MFEVFKQKKVEHDIRTAEERGKDERAEWIAGQEKRGKKEEVELMDAMDELETEIAVLEPQHAQTQSEAAGSRFMEAQELVAKATNMLAGKQGSEYEALRGARARVVKAMGIDEA